MEQDAESLRLSRAQQLFHAGHFADAAKLYQAILGDHPDHVEAFHRLGVIAGQMAMPERAIRLLRQALRLGGETAELLNEMGRQFVAAEDLENASRCFLRCRQQFSAVSLGYISGAYVENWLGQFDRALQIYQDGIRHVPDCTELQVNLATFLRERGRLDEAVALYHRLIARCPNVGEIRDGRARALLQQGRWADGWSDYEARLQLPDEPAKINLDLPVPRWQGEPLAGKQLLILCEQGIGDEVQFASCYQDVIAHAKHCTFTCSPRLVAILSRSFPQATFQPVEPTERETWSPENPTRFDYYVPAGSLPRHFRRRDADFPATPYLKPGGSTRPLTDPDGSRPRVGVSWWGGAQADPIRNRSIDVNLFQRIWQIPNVQFISIQHGCDQRSLRDSALTGLDNLRLHAEIDPYRDLDGWFDLIASLDLLVSVDNSNVHFAGSLGIETWLLLSDHPNWRWPFDLAASNWYPSVRFIRKFNRDWSEVIDDVTSQLEARGLRNRSAA